MVPMYLLVSWIWLRPLTRSSTVNIFESLWKKGVPPIFIRLLLEVYEKQLANVRWNGVLSNSFSVTNGVRQGAVLSPILYCIFIDGLFTRLRKKKTGCWVNGSHVGIGAYTDDLLLLSPTLNGLQEMTKTFARIMKIPTTLRLTQLRSSKSAKRNALHFLKKERY